MMNPGLPMDMVYTYAEKLGTFESDEVALGALSAAVWCFLTLSDFAEGEVDSNPHIQTLASILVAFEHSHEIDMCGYNAWKQALLDTFEMFEQKVDGAGSIAPTDMDNPFPE